MPRHAPRDLLMDAADRGARYLERLDARPVFPREADIRRLEEALTGPLPATPSDAAEVLAFLDEFGSPATVASAGGRYFGFVTGGALSASLAANWLAGAWDQNSFGFVSSPAAALFEERALGWLGELLGLPAGIQGAFATGATMANFTCLAAARYEVLQRVGWDVDSQGLFGASEIAVVVGEEVHATILKDLAMLGLGRDRVIRVPVDEQGRMRADALPDLAGPAIVCLQAGNVNSGAFDPAAALSPQAHAHGAWVHVDGAFGLWAKAAPALAPLAAGYEHADSWATDAHKWLNVPYDCGVAFVRSPASLRHALSVSGSYLLQGERQDAIGLSPEGSRRARAIEVWAAIKALGRTGIAELIERNCRQARWLADGLAEAGIEVLNEVVLNQVVVAFGDDDRTARTIGALQAGGVCWCGETIWRGRRAMRISVSSWATSPADMEQTLAAILAANEHHRET